jgi:hypothetical protein
MSRKGARVPKKSLPQAWEWAIDDYLHATVAAGQREAAAGTYSRFRHCSGTRRSRPQSATPRSTTTRSAPPRHPRGESDDELRNAPEKQTLLNCARNLCQRVGMAEILNEGPAHCPQCGAEVRNKIVETDHVDHEGEPRVDSITDCPKCGRVVRADIAN